MHHVGFAPLLAVVRRRALGRPGNNPELLGPRSFGGNTCQEYVYIYIYVYVYYILM